ncbi:hypothetical protein CH371_04290 [Leptospira wolffii]|uniref:Uncharacterized protein n=1 Tax=Leptospira wolffii TaxID=409998 RepID=A0A2M9ZHL1_9LEPT|nr:hypothetical protein [Leptospira wolffii]PJZ67911.1 hypothetical protein CH371_04290 [Leptospira wolffii]
MNILKKILFWFGAFVSLLIPISMILAESGTCTQGDDSVFFLFTQVAFAVSLFCLVLSWYGVPSGGSVGLVLISLPFFLSLYFYIAFVPVYFVYSTIHGLELCDVVQFDLVIGSPIPRDDGYGPGTFFARSYAIASLIPVITTFYPVYRVWKNSSFSRRNKS